MVQKIRRTAPVERKVTWNPMNFTRWIAPSLNGGWPWRLRFLNQQYQGLLTEVWRHDLARLRVDPSQIGFHLFRGENSKDVSKITNKYQEYQVGCMFSLSKSHCVYRVSGFHFAEFCLHWFRTFSNYSKNGRPRVLSPEAPTTNWPPPCMTLSAKPRPAETSHFGHGTVTAFHGKGETF